MALSDLKTLINSSAQNTSQFKGLSAAYGILLGGTPTIDGYTNLINTNNTTNFGAGGSTVFNDENIYINTINALYQGNPTAKASFDAIVSSAATIQDALTLVYNYVIPASARTEAGLNYFKSQASFYAARAAELGVAGTNGTALVAFASLTKIAVDNDIGGLGDTINDLKAAVDNNTAQIPQSGNAFTPLETADGTQFDADDVAGGGANQGQTYTLTTSADNVPGTGANDTITAYINTTTATVGQTTFSGADNINGAGGTDSLNLTVEGANAAGSLPAATITSVENFFIRDLNTSGASTYNFATVTGEQQVWNDRSTQAVTFSNLGAGTTVGVRGDNSNNVSATTFTMATATDAVSIAIDGGVKGSPNITRNQTGEAAVTITSTGAANTVGTIDLDTGTAIKAVTINATTNLTASLAADYAANATLTLKGAGKIDLSGAALSGNIATVNAADSAGGVSVIMGANNASFTGGAGDDTVSAGALVFNSTGTLNGGGGTNTIVLQDQAQLVAGTVSKISNFQVLRLNDDDDGALDTFDSSLISGLAGLVIGAQSAGDGVSVTKMSSALAGNVTIAGNQAVGPTFGVSGATTVGQLDTLSLKIDDGATAKNTITVADITAAGVETVKIATVDNLTLSATTGLTALTKLELSGSGNIDVTTGALALNVNSTIDASAATGTVAINASGATTNGLAIIGSSTKANTIIATNQADAITGGSANDTITHGNGIDTINISQGGDDIIVMDGIVAAANRAVVTGFTAGTFAANGGVDRLEMNDGQATTAFGAASATLQEVTSAPGSTLTFNTAANNVLELAFDLAGNGTANDLDSHTDGTGLLAALGQTLAVSATTNAGYVVAYQEGKAYLYHLVEGADGDANVAAADMALVGVFNNVTVGAFTASNFIDAV